MTTFDTDLVGRWFSLLLHGGDDHNGGHGTAGLVVEDAVPADLDMRPTAVERQVLIHGRQAIAAAVGWSGMPAASSTPADPAAAVLQVYLDGLATGIAGSRRAMRDAGDLDEGAIADRLSLVAGLIAGGAALQAAPEGLLDDDAFDRRPAGAIELARVAGTSAAELVVDGADLHSITTAAAAAAMVAGPPDSANRDPGYRSRALVAQVLLALQRSTAPARPPVAPPSCGVRPGVNGGAELLAEITFTSFLAQPDADRLERTLTGVAEEVVVWSEGDRRYFHVHSRTAGEVVAEAYSVGSVFSLEISRL